ncbi:hypothetical protein [Lysinibacillus sp. ZYM-1]|uniref:hypothetical protein n=1 Tax=Lysinibacillus sp. ZYM-1 TaxID=1681184 RepID=UPI0006CE77AC|nr:hypothetical protein [Lysinibacillus sp. ZYM-1]KPN89565.1 hypothetical protein AO843_07290 [Lysinibacillus sp. ZYM-1]
MNTKAMYEKTGVSERTIQNHMKEVRYFIPGFAMNRRGNNYFTPLEAEAYYVMIRIIEETNNVKFGIRALIEYMERQRVLARINTIVNNDPF